MFLVQKYHANGVFDKVKARLVADGRDEDPELYPYKSGIAAGKKWRVVVKIDIMGVFIQTPMSVEPMYVKLDNKVTHYVNDMYPHLGNYVEQDEFLYVQLLKAMHGCMQANALWYSLIRSMLEGMSSQVSETDRCVFRKQETIYFCYYYTWMIY